ncbi:glycosyltransferase family 2 protein [Cohnella zeiphila]|uniref:Glycosyltransferase n=1 Tax=Cohnella zeiphila TaxID=2761120 RepID=A0A7X0SLP8_9BACL|nr:glycosyltransferase [Cohnella zeiphila]MBB6732241.1 glycosyltransferase [Cohnella zeiphila]
MNKPLVSIIIPVYNTERYVRRSVESALAQSYEHIEVILVNDGSTDSSGKRCDEIALSDRRLKVIHQHNSGVSAARNAGLNAATGEYVQFLDSDDIIEKGMTAALVTVMQNQSCDLVACDFMYVNQDNKPRTMEAGVYPATEVLIRTYTDRSLWAVFHSACYMLFKREIIVSNQIQFNTEFVIGEDGLFALEYMCHCRMIGFVNEAFYKYYSYNLDERVSAVSYFPPDLYVLKLKYFERLFSHIRSQGITDADQRLFQTFIDAVIINLVHMGAYFEFFGKQNLHNQLRTIVNHPLVKQASRSYRRTRKTDSRLIPFFVRRRWVRSLYLVLKARGKKYVQAYGKKSYVKSIYRERMENR